MANGKNSEKTRTDAKDLSAESLWRKPIKLDSFEDDDDPLAALYRGREASNGEDAPAAPVAAEKPEKVVNKRAKVSASSQTVKKSIPPASQKTTASGEPESSEIKPKSADTIGTPKFTEAELKNILKIKSDSFQFTDLREILRGKSFEIYAFLRFLSGDTGVCKIKHLDLMKKLDISRPTLFKQGEWLSRLSLIEKRNVPGDHLGTTYRVYRLEEILPLPAKLIEQFQSHIAKLAETDD